MRFEPGSSRTAVGRPTTKPPRLTLLSSSMLTHVASFEFQELSLVRTLDSLHCCQSMCTWVSRLMKTEDASVLLRTVEPVTVAFRAPYLIIIIIVPLIWLRHPLNLTSIIHAYAYNNIQRTACLARTAITRPTHCHAGQQQHKV